VSPRALSYLILCVALPVGIAGVLTVAEQIVADLGHELFAGALLAGLCALGLGMPFAFQMLTPTRRTKDGGR
jgi:hypothetical protein